MKRERQEELEECLRRMQTASNQFYSGAVHAGNHAFIEFTGLMNEYIQLCAQALREGVDFTKCNIHNGEPLPMRPHNADYLAQKLECIYGASLTTHPALTEVLSHI